VKLSSTPTGIAVAKGGVAIVSSLKHITVIQVRSWSAHLYASEHSAHT
jgi:hypothetical protein